MKKLTLKQTIINKLKSVSGMTYVELITALGLLALIILAFTPMLLSSYQTLYSAGEKTQEVYSSREEIEEGLARRDSTSEINLSFNLSKSDLVVNAEKLFSNINITGRKIISTSKSGLETLFGQVVPRLELISPNVVYDDKTYHDIEIQTFGLKYDRVSAGGNLKESDLKNMAENQIHIEAIIPNKKGKDGTTTDTTVYDYGTEAKLKYIKSETTLTGTTDSLEEIGGKDNPTELSNKTDSGRIKLRVDSPSAFDIDFTYSPIKIRVYYKNRRGYLRELCTYLYIEAPTIMFAGQTNSDIDYFTSAGVEEKTNSKLNADGTTSQGEAYVFNVEPRTLRTDNSSAFTSFNFGAPGDKGVTIRSIKWIDNDETPGLKPYYVMVGTKGAIYRMYNYSSHNTDIFKLSTASDLDTRKIGSDAYTTGYGTKPTQGSVIDNTYDLADGTRVYSSLWSGDSTHYFDFSSWDRSTNYGTDEEGGNDNCWLTADQVKIKDNLISGDDYRNLTTGAAKYNLFGTQAKFSYYYNGYRINFEYKYQAARNISYILTEYGHPFRLFGFLKEESDFAGFTEVWYPTSGTDQITWVKSKNKSEDNVDCIPIFDGSPADRHTETSFAALRFQNFGSYNPNVQTIVNFMRTDGTATSEREQARQITDGYDNLLGLESEINLTDAVYIPKAGSSSGMVLYLGTVHAYMNLYQKDNISTADNYSKSVKNTWGDVPHAALTDYVIFGNADGTGTTVHKYSSAKQGWNEQDWLGRWSYSFEGVAVSEKLAKMNSTSSNSLSGDNRRNFFVSRLNGWKDMFMDDVYFTMGYSSNREKVYAEIVYTGTSEASTEYYRSYEHLYFQSHYGQGGVNTDGTPKRLPARAKTTDATLRNSPDNDYYNVWFPGEMYNLTTSATKDGVTVAVGYAVSGSTYQWINPNKQNNTSTALGGIYNDGVMSCVIEGQNNGYLKNILYFKDNATINQNFLAGTGKAYTGTEYNVLTTYGTHDRRSIQFTAVDLLVENQKANITDSTVNVNYYAYYGDNTGRVFRSLVAKGKGVDQGETNGTVNEAVVTDLNMVPYIRDIEFSKTAGDGDAIMYEIKTHDGKSLQHYFKNIGTIDISGTTILITGEMSATIDGEYIIVGIKEEGAPAENGGYNFYAVKNGSFKDKIYDAEVVGGYYYITGKGWVAAVSVDTLRTAAKSSDKTIYSVTDGSPTNRSQDKNKLLWTGTSNLEIYAVAGRDTN